MTFVQAIEHLLRVLIGFLDASRWTHLTSARASGAAQAILEHAAARLADLREQPIVGPAS